MQQVGRDDLGMQAPAQARGIDARRLFHDDHREALVHADAAVFLRHRGAEEAGGAGLGPDLAIDVACSSQRAWWGATSCSMKRRTVSRKASWSSSNRVRGIDSMGLHPESERAAMLPSKRLLDKQTGRDKNARFPE
jgi:hypothetical protein